MAEKRLIDIRQLITSKNPTLIKWLPGFVIRYLERVLHQNEINEFLATHADKRDADFCQAVVDYLNIDITIKGIEHIPKTGPVIVAMNHPLGGMDALSFVAALQSHRTDIKFIVNDLLMNLENLKGLFVGVNKHGKNSTGARAQIEQAFQENDLLCIFPAGLVSRRNKGLVRDLEWKKTFVTFSKKLNQPIIPVFIDGELSNFFYNLSNFRKLIGIKANIEMLYLADELFKQRNKKMTFTIGNPLDPTNFSPTLSDKEQAQEIRSIVYSLTK